ncbi:MAG: hypothetical protein AAGA48_26500 [Myxococcota bacterium]
MNRLFSTIRKDALLQVRYHFYTIALGLAALVAVVFCITLTAEHVHGAASAAILFLVGGTTFVFVGGLILDEKEKGILQALIYSPLRTIEYLASKVITLTALATVEVGILLGIPIAWFAWSESASVPHMPVLFVGIVAINLLYTLLGLGITVRFRSITDYLIPVIAVMIALQLPAIYFLGLWEHPGFLLIPSSAPVMLIKGAFEPIASWQWAFGAVATPLWLSALAVWATRSYDTFIVQRMS